MKIVIDQHRNLIIKSENDFDGKLNQRFADSFINGGVGEIDFKIAGREITLSSKLLEKARKASSMTPDRLRFLVAQWTRADKAMKICSSVSSRTRAEHVEKAYQKARELRFEAERQLIAELNG